MLTVTSQNFNNEVLNSEIPVICDFSAGWCGPCRALKPMLESLQPNGQYKVVMVDVDESQDLASEYDISAIPTILIVKKGQIVERLLGMQSKEKLLESVQ